MIITQAIHRHVMTFFPLLILLFYKINKIYFMERQVFLATQGKDYNSKRLESEIGIIEKMLPYTESFKAFYDSNEVLDIYKHTVIRKRKRLFSLYEHGIDKKTFVFAICKN